MKAILFSCAAAALLCTSCVTKEKYMLAENGRLEALARADRLNSELNVKRTENAQLSDRLAALCRDTTRLGNSIRSYQQLLAGNVDSQEKLTAMLNKKMQQLAERENTINELQDMITAQQEKVKSLLSSVKDALLGFNSDELTIREENGKVYFVTDNHSGNFSIASKWAGVHALNGYIDSLLVECFLDKAAGSTRANKVML